MLMPNHPGVCLRIRNIIIKLILTLVCSISFAQDYQQININLNNTTELNQLITTKIKEQYSFRGLASYLNQVQYYLVEDNIVDLNRTEATILTANQWLVVAGRYNVLLIRSKDATVTFTEPNQQITIQTGATASRSYVLSKSDLELFAPNLAQVNYNHLWRPLAIVAKLSESLLLFIKSTTSLSWGVVILIFAVMIKLLLLPVSVMTTKSQQKVSAISSQLQPRLREIKRKYDGEEAHNKIMQAHKDLGVSPFYTLKPMLSFFIQIPILIAIFNSLGEMPQLLQQPFLWFNDLSKPDMFVPLGFSISYLGSYVNLMPVLMTIIAIIATLSHADGHASIAENRKQKYKLYFMSASFFVLFYPFPAAMVMYWAIANLLQFVQSLLKA